METELLKSFSYLENGEIQYSNLSVTKTLTHLTPGFYNLKWLGHPQYRVSINVADNNETIKIFNFPDKSKLDSIINMFFDNKISKLYSDAGFNRKLGILLHGKQGCGKTSIIKYYCDLIIKQYKGLIFYIEDSENIFNIWQFIQRIRKSHIDIPIIIIFDEIDESIQASESIYKNILDGYLSIDNSIIFASTNYIDKIPEAIKNRPSRFKYCLNIEGIQDKNEIFEIIYPLLKMNIDKETIKEWANSLEGSSLDELKEFCTDKWMNLNTEKRKHKIGF